MEAIPWFAWIAIVAIVMTFLYAMVAAVAKSRGGSREMSELRRDLDAAVADGRELRARVTRLEHEQGPPSPPPAAGP